MTWNAGALGFKGTQTLGAVTVGAFGPAAATAWRFDSDPGAGTTITVPAGRRVAGNFALDQTFLSRLAGASAGTVSLGVNSANNLDFTAHPNLSLGAGGLGDGAVTARIPSSVYSGTITPGATGYRLGGGGGTLRLTNRSPARTPSPSTARAVVDLTQLTNTFSGAITLSGGSRERAQ